MAPSTRRTPTRIDGDIDRDALDLGGEALKNVQEFFAVTASLYLWGNVDRPPHDRKTLHDKQPVYYQWLGDQFGVVKSV
jgi:hypothetical protein